MGSISSNHAKKLKKLRDKLPSSATKTLADEFNFSTVHIRLILNGKRQNINVIEAAIELAKKEEKRLEKIHNKIDQLS